MASFEETNITSETFPSHVSLVKSEEDKEGDQDSTIKHAHQVQLRLERCLRHLGLTPFSSKFIMQFITVRRFSPLQQLLVLSEMSLE